MARVSDQDRRTRLLLGGVAVLVSVMGLVFAALPLGRMLERNIYDMWFGVRGALPKPSEVVVVKIDVESEESLGRYPWRRTFHARLVNNLARAGARVVAFDATFADPFPEDDAVFLEAIRSSGIVILGAKTLSVRRRDAVMRGLEEPAPGLREAPYGIVDINPDRVDGVIREYPIQHAYAQGTLMVPQLGVQALRHYLGMPLDQPLEQTRWGWRLGDLVIPRGPDGGMLIDYLGPTESVTTYSYVTIVDDADFDIGDWDMDAFEDLLAEERLRDKIVFVGSTIPEHHDNWPTPFMNVGAGGAMLMPGVEIHANAVDAILKGRFRRAVPPWVNLMLVIGLALAAVGLAERLRARWAGVIGLGLLTLLWSAAAYLFVAHQVWIWVAAPSFSVLLAYSGATVALYIVEQQEKARIRGMFQQYVPTRVVNELMAHPELLKLGGEERELTVLFSDVASFTEISEKLSPTELVSLLNEYLTAMTEIVLHYEGIIDKYQGDALMAEFGAPVPFDDHALRACRAALDMQAELERMRLVWKEQGRPQLEARTGINTGIMLVGNLGSRHIMDYTVMGDNVNLASRLEGTNKVYGTSICVSEMTWEQVRHEILGRELDLIRVKGKQRPVRIYEVLATTDAGMPAGRISLIERYELGLEAYRERRFDEAQALFEEIVALDAEDTPSVLYARRCREYLAAPPPEDWDGVFVMTTK